MRGQAVFSCRMHSLPDVGTILRFSMIGDQENLTQPQRLKREELSMCKLKLKTIKAVHIREHFQEIYQSQSYEEFERLLKKWYFWATHSRIDPIQKAAKTIKKHWQGIVQWKKSLLTNGLLEGLNSLIQAAKAKARGFRVFKYFKIVAFLVTGRFDFTQINKHYLPT